MCFRVMPCYMSRNAPVLMGLGISTPRSCLNLIAIQKAGISPSRNPGRISPISVPKTCPHSGSASSAATGMPFDAKGRRMTHAPPVLCRNTAVLQNALEQFPPHPEWFSAHTDLLPGEHPYQKAMMCSSGLLHPAEKDPRLLQPRKEAMAPSLPVWALS